ncbi:unnamed protein product, partial [Didymodactylos carnosus]
MLTEATLFLLVLPTIVNGIKCTDCTQSNIAFINASGPLSSTCENRIISNATQCQVMFQMNYLIKQIWILDFSLPYEGLHSSLVNYKIDQTVALVSSNMKYVATTYICSTEDNCAEKFYFDIIEKLIQKESILDEIQSELSFAANTSTTSPVHKCYDTWTNQTVNCSLCYGSLQIKYGSITEDRRCDPKDSGPSLESKIIQNNPSLPSDDQNGFSYRCNNQNLCNTKEQLYKIKELSNQFYTWILFNMTTTASTTSSTTTTSLLTSSTVDSRTTTKNLSAQMFAL